MYRSFIADLSAGLLCTRSSSTVIRTRTAILLRYCRIYAVVANRHVPKKDFRSSVLDHISSERASFSRSTTETLRGHVNNIENARASQVHGTDIPATLYHSSKSLDHPNISGVSCKQHLSSINVVRVCVCLRLTRRTVKHRIRLCLYTITIAPSHPL